MSGIEKINTCNSRGKEHRSGSGCRRKSGDCQPQQVHCDQSCSGNIFLDLRVKMLGSVFLITFCFFGLNWINPIRGKICSDCLTLFIICCLVFFVFLIVFWFFGFVEKHKTKKHEIKIAIIATLLSLYIGLL